MVRFYIVLCIFILTGCKKDLLDRNHPGDLNWNTLYKTKSDFEAALAGTYDAAEPLTISNIYIAELAGDNAYVSRFRTSGAVADLDRLLFHPQLSEFNSYWSNGYRVILQANLLINRIGNAQVDDYSKKIMIAEAKFLRAYAYFNLMRAFGGVPIYTQQADLQDIYNVPRASKEEVMSLIVEDLTEAAKLDSYRSADDRARAGGKATTAAAHTLLAKAYLWNRDFANAETILGSIVQSGQFELVDLETLYHPDQPLNKEIIWSINYERSANFSNPFVTAFIPYNAPAGSVYPEIQESTGAGNGMIEPAVRNKFETNDKRRTLLMEELSFENLGIVDQNIFSLKYIDRNTTFNYLSGANILIFRYADVLLMYAEALNENGKTGQAIGYINQVRQRAGIDELPAGLSKAETFQALADERQRELIMEGDRWYDLVFRGYDFLRSTLESFMPNAYLEQNRNLQVQERYMLFPIPSSQIQVKPVLQQNPGYN
ncbi:MAG TPA: RagB/SusD family nutrient uptake outer membrane protein [Flavihumibacter sp.]|jgi:hypothetical protein